MKLMNKFAIPTLLLGVVMIAGIFAFMPVQEASTVHTSSETGTLHNTISVGASVNYADGELFLFADTTPRTTVSGHIALQIPCDDAADQDAAFKLQAGNASGGTLADITLTFVAETHVGTDTDDVFDSLCTFHVDFTDKGPDFVLKQQTGTADIGNGIGQDVSLEGSIISYTFT